jgi:Tol biopolymer transport system component
MILGTAAYMSPEQARGRPVDERTDIWAFGCVLYEMLTARAAFTGETLADTLAAVLERQPDWDALPRQTPPEVHRLLERCLEKDKERRLDDITSALLQTEAGSVGRDRRWLLGGLAVAAVVAAVLLALGLRLPGKPPRGSKPALQIEKLTSRGNVHGVAISPDGRYLAYSSSEGGQATVWLRDIQEKTETRLVSPPSAEFIGEISFTRDGRSVSYSFAPRTGERPVYRVPVIGGEPRLVQTGIGLLSPDETTVASTRGNEGAAVVVLTDREGGHEREITGLGRGHLSTWSPDGTRLAFSADPSLFVVKADGTDKRRVAECGRPTWWRPDGKAILCSTRDGRLLGVDLVTGGTTRGDRTWRQVKALRWLPDGAAFAVNGSDDKGLSGIFLVSDHDGRAERLPATTHHYEGLGVTADGNQIVSVQGVQRSDISVSSAPSTGPFTKIVTGTGADYTFCWTPEGRIVYASNEGGSYDLYAVDADGSNRTQLTFDRTGNETEPAASPDGRFLVFVSDRTGVGRLHRVNRDGTDLKVLTHATAAAHRADTDPRVTPDGRWVLYRHGDNGSTVWKVPIGGGTPVLVKGARPTPPGGMIEEAFGASASPDGRFLAFLHFLFDRDAATSLIDLVVALPDGRIIKRFPYAETRRGGISAHEHVEWSRDGNALYYVNLRKGNRDVWRQAVAGGSPVQVTRFEEPVQNCHWSFDGKTLACARSLTLRDVVRISNFR